MDLRPEGFSEKLTKATEQDPVRYDGRLAYSWSRRPLTKHAILLTQEVYDGLRAEHPASEFLTKGSLKPSTVRVKGYAGRIYGTDAYFLAVQQTR